jgi:hypothetical protein
VAVVETFEAVDALEAVEDAEVRDAEEVVEDVVAATVNLSPNTSVPEESVSERKKVLPGIANTPGVHEYEFEVMPPAHASETGL